MTRVLSAHDLLRFRRRYAGWEVHQVFLRGAELFYLELIEELPEDTVRWALQRADGRAILSVRGAHADVPASLFDEVIATHRAAIVAYLERYLEEALVDLHGARAREVRAVIAMIKR